MSDSAVPDLKMPPRHRLACRRLRAFALLAAVCFASSVEAHDFWVQPNEYWLTPEVATPMTLQVGHGPFRQRSAIRLSRITRFEAVTPEGTTIDLRDNLHPGGDKKDGDLRLRGHGAYVLVLETDDQAQSHLPAIRFNDYLKVEGLTPALEQRQQTHRMDADGSENYSRRAKSIVQVGPPEAGSQAQVTRPVGLPLEIVPEQSPYTEPRPAILPVRVIYEGHPLAGALIKLTNLEHDATPLETHLTDRDGRASFTMPKDGTWLLNVIWTKPLPSSRDTDFETVFSSLSFGFPALPVKKPWWQCAQWQYLARRIGPVISYVTPPQRQLAFMTATAPGHLAPVLRSIKYHPKAVPVLHWQGRHRAGSTGPRRRARASQSALDNRCIYI